MTLLTNSSLPKINKNIFKEFEKNIIKVQKTRPEINSIQQNQIYPTSRFTVNVPSLRDQNSLKILSPFYPRNHHQSPEKCQCYVHRMKRIKLIQKLQKQKKGFNSKSIQIQQYQNKIISILKDQHSLNTKLINKKQIQQLQINIQKVKKIKQDYSQEIYNRQMQQKCKIKALNQKNQIQKANVQSTLKERLEKVYTLDHHNIPFQQILLKRNMNSFQKKCFVKKVLGFLKWKSQKNKKFVESSKPFILNYLKPIIKKMQICQIVNLSENTQSQNPIQNYQHQLKIDKISKIMNVGFEKTKQVINDIKIVLQQLRIFEQQNKKLKEAIQKQRKQKMISLKNQQKNEQVEQKINQKLLQNNSMYFSQHFNTSKRSSIQNNSNSNESFLINSPAKLFFQNEKTLDSSTKYKKKQSKNNKSLNSSLKNTSNLRVKKNIKQQSKQNQAQQSQNNKIQVKHPFFQDWMQPIKKKEILDKYKNIKYQQYCSKEVFQNLALNIDQIIEDNSKAQQIYNKLQVRKILFQQEIVEDLILQFKPMFSQQSVKKFRQIVIKNRTKKLLQKLNKQIDEGLTRIKKQKTQYEEAYIEDFELPSPRKRTQQSVSSKYSNNKDEPFHCNKIPIRRLSQMSNILRISGQIITHQCNLISQKDLTQSICEVKQQQNYCSRIIHQQNKENNKNSDQNVTKRIDLQKSQKQKEILKYMKKKHNKMFQKLNYSFNSLSLQTIKEKL